MCDFRVWKCKTLSFQLIEKFLLKMQNAEVIVELLSFHLVISNLKTQLHAVRTCWKRLSQYSFMDESVWVKLPWYSTPLCVNLPTRVRVKEKNEDLWNVTSFIDDLLWYLTVYDRFFSLGEIHISSKYKDGVNDPF